MFAGLKHLRIESAWFRAMDEFWVRLLSSLPKLETLELPKCLIEDSSLASLFEVLKSTRVVNLEIDYNKGEGAVMKRSTKIRKSMHLTHQH